MKLLNNKKAWKSWLRVEGLDNNEPKPAEPIEYPCFGYTTLRSFGYEELNENYLYRINLEEMLAELRRL